MKEVINLVGYFEYMSRVTRETDAHIWFIFVVYLRRMYMIAFVYLDGQLSGQCKKQLETPS